MKSFNNIISLYIFILIKILITLLLIFLFIIFHILSKNNKSNEIKMSLVIPIISRDFDKIRYNFFYYKKKIDCINNLVFIGDEKVGKLIRDKQSNFEIPMNFINENVLINTFKVKNLIRNRNKSAVKRSGWYIQQFLKMQHCKICQDNYYLIWDSDTIPVKKVKMFNNNGEPFFDVKKEYHKPYFTTMKKIFPELGKKNNYSFISEHMLIKTEIMKNLIKWIENNNNIVGDTWYEKVINCIDKKELKQSGFSEFETYGTFVNKYYNKYYNIRSWKSLRRGKQYYNPKCFKEKNLLNIAKKYDAISFEK